jgi:hypothetical protein
MKKALAILLALGVLAITQQAQASLLFNLNPASLTGLPGETLTFNATLSNTGEETLFLNGLNSIMYGEGLYVDDSLFWATFPFYLDPGETFTSDMFTVEIAPDIVPDDYVGSITILGGAEEYGYEPLATQNFMVEMEGTPSVPGPAAVLPMTVGLGLGWLRRCRRR